MSIRFTRYPPTGQKWHGNPAYGFQIWSARRGHRALDVWIGKRLLVWWWER